MAKKKKAKLRFIPYLVIAVSVIAVAIGVQIIQGDFSFNIGASGTRVPQSCRQLRRIVNRAVNSSCGDSKYNPVADLNKDGKITSDDRNIVRDHLTEESWCDKSQEVAVDFCQDNVTPLNSVCGELFHEYLVANNSLCAEESFNSLVDFNKDEKITILDFSIFSEKQGQDGWCQERLDNQEETSCDLPNVGPVCKKLFQDIRGSFNTQCGDENYNPVVDIDKDKFIKLSDFSIFSVNSSDEDWCVAQYNNKLNACDPNTTTVAGDCNGDGIVDAADLSALNLELSDGDNSDQNYQDSPNGSFAGTYKCDANADKRVNEDDSTCIQEIIFGDTSCTTGQEDTQSNLSVEFVIDSDWDTGYCGDFYVTNNTSDRINSWEIKFEMQDSITDKWSGRFSSNNNITTVLSPIWGNRINPGQRKKTAGLCAKKTGNTNYLNNISVK